MLELALTAALATVFTVVVANWGTHAMQRVMPHVERTLRAAEARFVFALSLLFLLSSGSLYRCCGDCGRISGGLGIGGKHWLPRT